MSIFSLVTKFCKCHFSYLLHIYYLHSIHVTAYPKTKDGVNLFTLEYDMAALIAKANPIIMEMISSKDISLGDPKNVRTNTSSFCDFLLDNGYLKDLGAKYLVFVSSRSVKMRGFSFLSLYKSLFIS